MIARDSKCGLAEFENSTFHGLTDRLGILLFCSELIAAGDFRQIDTVHCRHILAAGFTMPIECPPFSCSISISHSLSMLRVPRRQRSRPHIGLK